MPAASPEDLQSTQDELIAKLRQVLGFNQREFQRLTKGMENMGGFWFVWVEGRIQAFFDVLYQVFTRFALLMVWLPFALILMLPSLIIGLALMAGLAW